MKPVWRTLSERSVYILHKPAFLVTAAWTLASISVALALTVWSQMNTSLTAYSVFPLIGLLSFGLMWSHYVIGAIRRLVNLPVSVIQSYLRITGYIVLVGIILHPVILEVQLYIDGLGLPPGSLSSAYPAGLSQIAIALGFIALSVFLAFELHRYFRGRPWWKYVEYANIIAMLLILWHGFVLGGELRSTWFQGVWIMYAITFVASVGYSEYRKRKETYARD